MYARANEDYLNILGHFPLTVTNGYVGKGIIL